MVAARFSLKLQTACWLVALGQETLGKMGAYQSRSRLSSERLTEGPLCCLGRAEGNSLTSSKFVKLLPAANVVE